MSYQPKTGRPCICKPGIQRDNCPQCEGTGQQIDFQAIRSERMFDIREPSIEALRAAPVYFRYGSNKRRVLVDALTARAILACYDALSSAALKAKMERMIAASPNQLTRVADFCFRHVKLGA